MTNRDDLVPYDGTNDNHFCTLNLLRLYAADGQPVYFVVDGLANVEDDNSLDRSYYYDEHSCPTNYVQVEAIMTPHDDDPHGVFDYVVSRWMPKHYPDSDEKDQIIRELFPEIEGGVVIDGDSQPLVKRLFEAGR